VGAFTVITQPTAEPITVLEAKGKLSILHDDEDDRITGMIKSAREFAEDYCGIYIMTTVVELALDKWPSMDFNLNTWPLQSIDSIKYDDTSSPTAEVTLVENVDYYADTTTEGGRVSNIGGWPSLAIKPNPIRIRMTAGYSSAADVPYRIKEGIMTSVVALYDMDQDLDKAAKSILWQNRIL